MIEYPQFRNVITDLSERKRDGLLTAYWQRWLKGFYEALIRPLTIVAVTASQALGTGGSFYIVDASAAPVVLTLPTAKDGYGLALHVKKIDSSPNAVTIQPAGAELIDGAATLVINVQYVSKSFTSSGSAWWVIQ